VQNPHRLAEKLRNVMPITEAASLVLATSMLDGRPLGSVGRLLTGGKSNVRRSHRRSNRAALRR
jgi:hypothetical protein